MAEAPNARAAGMAKSPPVALGEALQLANRHRLAGRLAEAEAYCRRILEAQPNEPNALHMLGVIAHQSGQLGEAIEHLRRAVKAAPDAALFRANLGEMYRLAGRVDDAIAEGQRAVKLKPDAAEALSNLGVALYERGEYEDAAAHHRRAAELRPDFALAHSNYGNALHALKRFDEAIAAYRKALELDANFADAWSNLGTTLHHAGRYDEAIAALRRSVLLSPNHANAHSGLGILLLMRGDFAEGFDEYEWRLQSTEVKGPRFPQRPWRGESLAGRHIYVQAEQGYGDTIQFARYLPRLRARAGAVSFRVHPSLLSLLRDNLPGIELYGDRVPSMAPDCDIALLSLPRMLRTRIESIPANVPYLHAPADVAARWQRRLGAMPGVKVGLVWAGRPEHANNFRRSLDLAMLAPVLAVPGVSFASLQVGPAAAELAADREHGIEDLSPQLADFAETAGAIAALDLVIAVDTAVAHLAGALGKPVWVLLPSVTDWRWLLGRDDNPWYPTMRLFRQTATASSPASGGGNGRGDWSPVVARVAAELAAIAAGDASRLTPFREAGARRAAMAAEMIAAEDAAAAAPPPAVAPAPLTAPQALLRAEQKRRAGRLGEAEDLARAAVAAQPGSAEAEHSLALTAYQSGRLNEAIEHLRRAVALDDGNAGFHTNLGEMCRMAGRVDEAITHAQRAIAIDPRQFSAHSNLGIALFQRGQFEEALACYDRSLAANAKFIEAHNNRGNALRALKRLDEAEAAYRRALEINPRYAAAWNNLGTTLRDLHRPEEAVEAYRKALAERPTDPHMLDNLALALKDLGALDEAGGLLRRAVEFEPRDPNLHLHLGSILIDQGSIDAAAAAFERSLAIDPRSHDTINFLGRAAFERGDLEGAVAHYRRALALKPDLADAHNNMGNVLKELGQIDEANEAYYKALAIDPGMVGAYVNLFDSKKLSADDPHLAAARALERAPLPPTERMQLNFALAKACEDLNEHERSFDYLLQANAQQRAATAYDEAAAMALFDRIEAAFTPAVVAARGGLGEPSRLPIFIVGMPRSGTSLIEQILASHRDVRGAGELKLMDQAVTAASNKGGGPVFFPEFVAEADAALLQDIGARYVGELRRREPGGAHVTDKMPSNFFFAGMIHLALPNAAIVHVMRDPVDTCVSCFSKLFRSEQSFTYDLAELGRYYRRYERLMDHWRRVLPRGRILDVAYEEVVADIEGQARRILAHCGLPWDPRCLEFYRTQRPVRTASAIQVRQPIYASSVGRARVYGEQLRPLLDALGLR